MNISFHIQSYAQLWPLIKKWLGHFHISYQNSEISWQKMSLNLVDKVLENWISQKIPITKNMPLKWYSSMKIDFESQKSALLVSWFSRFGKRYEIDLRVIFHQWPKLGLGLDVEAEIRILKVNQPLWNNTYLFENIFVLLPSGM